MAFLTFTASVLLVMGGDLLHFCSLLSISTFLVFAAVVSLRISGPRFAHPALRWPRISPVDGVPLPLPTFVDGSRGPSVLGFCKSCSSQFPSGSFSLVCPFVPEGNFVTFLFIFSLYIILYNGFCFLLSFLYIMVSVFFPPFCTGLLLRGCYM